MFVGCPSSCIIVIGGEWRVREDCLLCDFVHLFTYSVKFFNTLYKFWTNPYVFKGLTVRDFGTF